MEFYLGTHKTHWLRLMAIPLFVSRRRLATVRELPRALGRWALDSGGFSELSMFGRWKTGPRQYAEEAVRYQDEIGQLDFAATQDWMCEPVIINGGMLNGRRVPGTHLSVAEHQRRTVQSYLDLTALAPTVPWAPVLQGFRVDDYLDCHERYVAAGVDLARAPVVGIGSICRRQGTREALEIIRTLSGYGLPLHGFGMKTLGLRKIAHLLASSDSMAWSYDARRSPPLEGHTHKNCANCMEYALAWRDRLGVVLARPTDGTIFDNNRALLDCLLRDRMDSPRESAIGSSASGY
jgi:hypothetical protein